MFKNKIILSHSHPLSKKEKKDIVKQLKSSYKYAENDLNYILTSFNEMKIQKASVQNKKINIIFEGQYPIFFEYDKNMYLPTVYALEMFNRPPSTLLKNIVLIHDQTSEFLLNGADLMLKGVLNLSELKNSVSNFPMGEPFFIETTSGRVVGVGTSLYGREFLRDFDGKESFGGKFLRVLHRIGDALWMLGEAGEVRKVWETEVERSKGELSGAKKEGGEMGERSGGVEDEKECGNNIENKGKGESNEGEEGKICEIMKDKELDNGEDKDNDENKIVISFKDDINNNITYNKEEIDKNLNTVFFTLCKMCLQNEKFPLDPGKLYKELMKPLAEEMNVNIDVRMSSYKKISEYFKFLDKEKLLNFSKSKGQNSLSIQRINFASPILQNFPLPQKRLKFFKKNEAKSAQNPQENLLLSQNEKIDVTNMYKPNQKLRNFFERFAPGFGDGNEYFTIGFCKEVLVGYLRDKGLFCVSEDVNEVKEESEEDEEDDKEKAEEKEAESDGEEGDNCCENHETNKETTNVINITNGKDKKNKTSESKMEPKVTSKKRCKAHNTHQVKLDEYLSNLLNIKEDKYYEGGKKYSVEFVLNSFMRNLIPKSFIVKSDGEGKITQEIINSSIKIDIVSKKLKSKKVTVISGLEHFINLTEASKILQKHFATSVTVKDELFGLKNCLLLQGHFVDEMVQTLTAELKINKKFINVVDKLKSNKSSKGNK